jgi:hypothetical protein
MKASWPLVSVNAQHARQGGCQSETSKWQGVQHPAPICQDTLATHMVNWNLRGL